MPFKFGFLAFATTCFLARLPAATSTWVYPGSHDKLVYRTLESGDRIADFSFAGYRGGGVAFPDPSVDVTLAPSSSADDDDTAGIQKAVDALAAKPLVNGVRGTVLLGPGVFHCDKSIVIKASGVVVRGCGSARGEKETRTTIVMRGPAHTAFVIGSPSRSRTSVDAAHTTITDAYVPAGTTSFNVASPSGFKVGDRVALIRPATRAWIHFMQMDDLVRAGEPQAWFQENAPAGVTTRTIAKIEGQTLTCDLPLCDSYDAKYLNPPGATVVKIYPSPSAATDIGIEHLHLQCPPRFVAFGRAPYSGFLIAADDCWVDDVSCEEVMNTNVLLGNRLTLRRMVITHSYPNRGAAKPSDFSVQGSQILIDRCEITGDNEYFVWTTGRVGGPNVVLNSVFRGRISRIQPHAHWSTGMLVDNCVTPDDGIDFMNRGVAGNGFGWGMAWAVAWNCIAHNYLIQNPPGGANWAIGCIGQQTQTPRMFAAAPVLPLGIIDSSGVPVTPQSLYLAQLQERLGAKALAAIGYRENSAKEFPGRATPPLPPLPPDIDPQFGPNLALRQAVDVSSERDDLPQYGGESALDGRADGYWATKDGSLPATLETDFEGPVALNTVVLEEAPGPGHAIKAYKVEGMIDSDWQLLTAGTTVGEKKVAHFPTKKIWKIRLTVADVEGYVALHKLGLYLAPESENASP